MRSTSGYLMTELMPGSPSSDSSPGIGSGDVNFLKIGPLMKEATPRPTALAVADKLF
jgi:hypothetical protein